MCRRACSKQDKTATPAGLIASPMNLLRTGQAVACMFRSAAQRQTVAKGSPNCICAGGRREALQPLPRRPHPLFRSLPPAVDSPMNPLRTGQAVACMFRSAAQRQTVAKGSPNCICAGGRREASQPLPLAVLTLFSVSSARGEFADEPAPNRASGGMNIPFCRAPANGCEKFPESRMRRRGGKPDASVEKRGRGMKNRTILRSGVKPSCGIVRRPG